MATALDSLSKQVFKPEKELSAPLLEALETARSTQTAISKDDANAIADAMRTWAKNHGAVSFAHVFSPMRSTNAEKLDSFLHVDFATGNIEEAFPGALLFAGESDGSSFPNGGLRDTHAAAAYTAWDTTSNPYVRGRTLCIPSTFTSWHGDALDEKTPLLRSQAAVNTEALALLDKLGDTATQSVICNVGWEQEFFVVDRAAFLERPDLIATGRTLLGGLPRRNQDTDHNYFGRIPERVRSMLRDAQSKMWSMGVSCMTLHNEVAPAQHETASIFTTTNVAADQNALAMEILSEVAHDHGLEVLFHEKPFAGLNGSGKHNNWGLNTDTGGNLFSPGKTEEEQRRFVVFTAALMHALNHHGDLVRMGVASAGNDHRLGAQEAPPAIMSLYLGPSLTTHLERAAAGAELAGYSVEARTQLSVGSGAVLPLFAQLEDRNRTAPFPFCGNRFEFRAVGSAQHIGEPLTNLHAAMCDGMATLNALVSGGMSVDDATRTMIKDNWRVLFNGDGYGAQWHREAEERGLPNLRNTPAALEQMTADKNVALFSKFGILSEDETHARRNVRLDSYTCAVQAEAETMYDMVAQGLLPAANADMASFAPADAAPNMAAFSSKKTKVYDALAEAADTLEAAMTADTSAMDEVAAAYNAAAIKDTMDTVRTHADATEFLLPATLAPFPKTDEILYGI